MRIQQLPVDGLVRDPRNARTHSKENIEAIKRSLSRFGQQKPIIVDKEGVVVAGNGTLQAASELKWERISAVRTTLEGEDVTAYAVADNRSAELAKWDYAQLADTIRALEASGYDVEDTGWSHEELGNILNAAWEPAGVNGELEDFTADDRDGSSKHTIKFTSEQWQRLVKLLGEDNLVERLLQVVETHVAPPKPEKRRR